MNALSTCSDRGMVPVVEFNSRRETGGEDESSRQSSVGRAAHSVVFFENPFFDPISRWQLVFPTIFYSLVIITTLQAICIGTE